MILTLADILARTTLTAAQQAQASAVIAAAQAAMEGYLRRTLEQAQGVWLVRGGELLVIPSPPLTGVRVLSWTGSLGVRETSAAGWVEVVRDPPVAEPWRPRRITAVRLARYIGGALTEVTLPVATHPTVGAMAAVIAAQPGWQCPPPPPEWASMPAQWLDTDTGLDLDLFGEPLDCQVDHETGMITLGQASWIGHVIATHGWPAALIPAALREALLLEAIARFAVAEAQISVAAGIRRRRLGDREIEFFPPSSASQSSSSGGTPPGLFSPAAAALAAPWRLTETSTIVY